MHTHTGLSMDEVTDLVTRVHYGTVQSTCVYVFVNLQKFSLATVSLEVFCCGALHAKSLSHIEILRYYTKDQTEYSHTHTAFNGSRHRGFRTRKIGSAPEITEC